MADMKTSPRLSKSIGDIRSGLFARIEAVQDEYAAKGWLPARLNLNKGIARGFIELFAWGLWQLYNFLDRIHRQAIPRESTGDWLDVHAAQVDETRKPATKTHGKVLFLRGDVSGNVRIPAGRILRTKPDGTGTVYRYVTEALAVLPDGADSVAVSVVAEEYGQSSNAALGQICELVTPVEGVRGVTNGADWLTDEGADEESDASLQRRYELAWKAKAGVTRAAYEAAALSVPGVVDVYVADQHPRGEGTVDVVVQGSAGIPTAKLLEAVKAALDNAIVINHDVKAKASAPVSVSVRAVLELLDAVITDPPYSTGGMTLASKQISPAQKYQNSGTKKIYPAMLGDTRDQRSYVFWATLWLSECWRVARDGSPLLVFTDWRQLPSLTDAVQAAGFLWRGVVVWHKPSARPMMGEFRRDSEFHSVRFQRQAAQSHAQMLSRRHQMPSEHGGKSPYYRKNLAAVARAYGNREARRDRA